MAIVVALADELNRGFEGKAVGIGDFEAEFSVGLSMENDGEGKQEDGEVEERAHGCGESLCYQFRGAGLITKGMRFYKMLTFI